MTDFEARVYQALSDGMIDKKEVNSLFSDLTVEDWRALAKNHGPGSEVNKGYRKNASDITGMWNFNDFNIQEKDNEFLIKNDKSIVDSHIGWQGFKNFVKFGAASAGGFLLARAWRGSTAGLIVGGAIGLGGVVKNYFDTKDLKEIKANDYSIPISKDGLNSAEAAMNTNFRSGALSSLMSDAAKHRNPLG
jgi:hypothetical protein